MNKIERIIIQRTATTDEEKVVYLANRLRRGIDEPPCQVLAREACERTQAQGKGGTIILTFSNVVEPPGHLSFVPERNPEDLEKKPFTTMEPSWPDGTPIEVEFRDIQDYHQQLGATITILVPIDPHEDFFIKEAEMINDPVIGAIMEEFFPEDVS